MTPFLGIALLIAVAVSCSNDRRSIRWGVVVRALVLQAAIGAFVLFVPLGRTLTDVLSEVVLAIIGASSAGIEMVFGGLVSEEIGFTFALNALPVIVFFSSLMAVLYHLGLMPWVVRIVGGGLQLLLGVSRVEALNAAANVFVGLTEAPLAIRPFLSRLSEAQLFCVMSSGVASVAGTVLAAYALMGVRLDYLLAASFMAAPGGLVMAKLLMPDGAAAGESPRTEEPEPLTMQQRVGHQQGDTLVLAAARGAADGLRLAVNIGAMLIAFVSLISLCNLLLGWVGRVAHFSITLEQLFGWLFAPVMFLLGLPWSEAQVAGSLFGQKLVLNEFVAFLQYGEAVEGMSARGVAVVTFSLCGFANFAAIAVLLGGLGELVPERRQLIARLGPRVVLAGSLSNLMSAALASLVLSF